MKTLKIIRRFLWLKIKEIVKGILWLLGKILLYGSIWAFGMILGFAIVNFIGFGLNIVCPIKWSSLTGVLWGCVSYNNIVYGFVVLFTLGILALAIFGLVKFIGWFIEWIGENWRKAKYQIDCEERYAEIKKDHIEVKKEQ